LSTQTQSFQSHPLLVPERGHQTTLMMVPEQETQTSIRQTLLERLLW
jgi:hypothetical protein